MNMLLQRHDETGTTRVFTKVSAAGKPNGRCYVNVRSHDELQKTAEELKLPLTGKVAPLVGEAGARLGYVAATLDEEDFGAEYQMVVTPMASQQSPGGVITGWNVRKNEKAPTMKAKVIIFLASTMCLYVTCVHVS